MTNHKIYRSTQGTPPAERRSNPWPDPATMTTEAVTMLLRWINTEQDFLTLAGTQYENVIEFSG